MISALNRKLIRDMWGMKGQALAISSVIACGIATFVMSLSTLASLQESRETYYDEFRFAHIFTALKRAPNALAARIAEIPGVAQVQTRIVMDVTLDVEDLMEPAVGRLISIDPRSPRNLNELHLRRGRLLETGRNGEALVNEAFANKHGLEPGDSVTAVINGREQELHIVGLVMSPEYILQLRGVEHLPDEKLFGVFWMGYDDLAAAFDMDGAFNNVVLTMMHSGSEPAIIQRLDDLTEPYGGAGAHGREDQLSHRFLTEEFKQLRTMAMLAPCIFLAVAAFLLNVVLSRIISTQRDQIAALKAFGYSNREVGLHYLCMALVIAVTGMIAGIGVGAWLGRGLTLLYTRFYHFPVFTFFVPLELLGLSTLIACGSAAAGTLASVRQAVKLPPAEAMRPEPPADFRATFIERTGLQKYLSPPTRMIVRHLERRPFKALLSVVGIALAVAVLILGNFMEDSLNYLMTFAYRIALLEDVTLAFVEPTSPNVLHEVERLPGVLMVEPFRAAPTRLRHGARMRRIGIQGLPEQALLHRIMDTKERVVAPPPDGLLISRKLGELLGCGPGDWLTVEILEGQRRRHQLQVTAQIEDYNGTNAFMEIGALNRLLQEDRVVSGAFIAVDASKLDELYRILKATPRVAAVTVKDATLRSFQETVAENLLRIKTFNVIFASIIAFGVVYNSARISLAERSRELATLRVIGFTRAEISGILLGELAILTLAAIPFGLVIGYLFAAFSAMNMDTEMFRIPLVVDLKTYAFATTVTLIAAILSGLVVRSRLDHLDLVAVLKMRE